MNNQMCRFAETGILFKKYGVLFCCYAHTTLPIIFPSLDDFDVDEYLMIRKKNRTEPMPACETCPRYVEGNWNKNGKLKVFHIADSDACNFKCEYCVSRGNTPFKEHYTRVLPILKEFYHRDLIDENAHFSFAAGEPALCKGIDEVLDFVNEINGVIVIASNCSVYSKTFESVLREKRAYLTCSIDAGTRETFRKVKGGVDCFDKVIENISKYVKEAQPKTRVKSKYIIYDSNYQFKEIIEFVKIMYQIGIKLIVFDFNSMDRHLINEKYLRSMALGRFLCEKLDISVEMGPTRLVIDSGFSLDDKLNSISDDCKDIFESIFDGLLARHSNLRK